MTRPLLKLVTNKQKHLTFITNVTIKNGECNTIRKTVDCSISPSFYLFTHSSHHT